MLNWNIITSAGDYDKKRLTLLKLLEGSTTKPYVDGVGDATIGIGFNLVYNLEPVLRAIVASHWNQVLENRLQAQIDKDYSSSQGALLIANLNAVMKTWHDTRDSAVPVTFAFTSDAQIIKALDSLDDYYDGRIDSWVAGIPDSSERAALFSLTWNAPNMLGPKLKAAIESGNRAEAWYEIRYNSLSSSLPDSVKGGIANRRYVEADTFNLYRADGHATLAEAIYAGRMLANHHTTILSYEAAYDPIKAASVKGVATITTISTELQPAIATILKQYQVTVGHTLEEVLAAGPGKASIAGDGTAYDSTGNDDDLLLGTAGKNILAGNTGRDVLIGLGGDDRMSGGRGADIFVFTSAADSSIKTAGDTITDFGTGDRLEFAGKTDFTLLSHAGDAFSAKRPEIHWFWSQSNTVVEADYNGDGQADLHVTLVGKHSLSASDFIL